MIVDFHVGKSTTWGTFKQIQENDARGHSIGDNLGPELPQERAQGDTLFVFCSFCRYLQLTKTQDDIHRLETICLPVVWKFKG